MAWDFLFDEVTKDTIPDGKGSIVTTEGAETQVAQQLSHEFGAWWGDPPAGSKLHNLKVFGPNPATSIQAEAARALGVLADRGVIDNPTANATESTEVAGRVRLVTTSRDSRTGRAIKTGADQ